MSEQALIERITRRNPARPGTLLGIGDDAAVLDLGTRAVVSHDMLVEGVHFRRASVGLEAVGRKAVAVNLSDLAAMGAEPVAILVGLGMPPGELAPQDVDALYAGIDAVAREHGVTVAGGDLTRCPELVLAVTALGRMPAGAEPVRRSWAREGDVLCVTGRLGAAAAGLLLDDDPGLLPDLPQRADLVRAHLDPSPRVEAGRGLAAAGAGAMMDISDGLALDAGRLATASRVRAVLELPHVPVAPGVAAVAEAAGSDPALFAATGGDDYELLVAAPPRRLAACRRAAAAAGVPLTAVGVVEAGPPGALLRDAAGRRVVPDRAGWQHEL